MFSIGGSGDIKIHWNLRKWKTTEMLFPSTWPSYLERLVRALHTGAPHCAPRKAGSHHGHRSDHNRKTLNPRPPHSADCKMWKNSNWDPAIPLLSQFLPSSSSSHQPKSMAWSTWIFCSFKHNCWKIDNPDEFLSCQRPTGLLWQECGEKACCGIMHLRRMR